MRPLIAFIPIFYGFGSFHIPQGLGQLSSNAVFIICAILITLSLLRIFSTAKLHAKEITYFVFIGTGIFNSIHYGLRYEIDYGKLFSLTILYSFYLSPLLFISKKNIIYLTQTARFLLALNVILILSIHLLGFNWQDVIGKHFTYVNTNDPRPRGFFSEVSKYGAYILWLILLSSLTRAVFSWKSVSSYLGIVMLLKSKGTLVAALPTVMFLKSPYWRMIIGITFGTSIVIIFVSSIVLDFQMFLSASTRLFLFLCSLDILLRSPLGVGFGGLEHSLVSTSISPPSYALPFMNSEITDTISQGVAVSTKSGLMDMILIFGAPFVFFLIYLMMKIIKNRRFIPLCIITVMLLYTDNYTIFSCLIIIIILYDLPRITYEQNTTNR